MGQDEQWKRCIGEAVGVSAVVMASVVVTNKRLGASVRVEEEEEGSENVLEDNGSCESGEDSAGFGGGHDGIVWRF